MLNQDQIIATDQVPAWDREVEVLIAGQGIAGACAALEAHRAGAKVLIVERASGGGGASAMSQGIFYLGGGTPVQAAAGYSDSAENLYAFLRASTSHPDDTVLHAFADGALSHFKWLEQEGVPFPRSYFKEKAVFLTGVGGLLTTGNEKAWPFSQQAEPVPRGHQVLPNENGSGNAAMTVLLANCENGGIATLYDAQVTALVKDGRRVVGVRVRKDGRDLFVRAASGVVLATGGFNSNPEMLSTHVKGLSETTNPIGTPYNDGSGITLGLAAGAATSDLGGIIATGSIYPPGQLIKGIIVNARGERFINEDVYHGRLASFIMEQPGQTAYLIVDNDIFAYPEMDGAKHALVDGWETVEEMESGLDLPKGSLVKTLADYNRDAANAEDSTFHKHAEWLSPLDAGPYAAFDISFNKSVYSYLTLGGLRTNARAEVLDAANQPIQGLYAAGACASHIPQSGKEYASGLSLGPGSFFGRQAGLNAAAKAGEHDVLPGI